VKLLFDQNLSPSLVRRLADLCPGSSHVSFVSLERAMDEDVWTYARTHDFVIVTQDADFGDLGLVRGFPPKVVWLRLGNCTTQQIEQALRANWSVIANLDEDPNLGIVVVS
jgi:predicted nuclease of predicted toxin-antitoxin system